MTAKSEFKVSMEDRKQTYVIIPAYNEETRVRPVIEAIADMGFKIILVNDGSSDGTLDVLKDVQMKYPENIFIYSHVINRGVGLAMQTGFEAVLKYNPKYIVNIDADGQHSVDDLERVLEPLIAGRAEAVIGVRSLSDMPKSKNFGNSVMNILTHIFYGVAIADCMHPDRVIIGAQNDEVFETLKELYSSFIVNSDRFVLMDVKSAEMSKYVANALLATKISFMNEIANICEKVGANVKNVRLGIGSDKRIGYDFIYAGCGYGGSCFPKDVKGLINTALDNGYEPKILANVDEVNENQKLVLVNKIVDRFGEDLSGLTFGIWGLSFKPQTDDVRCAPSLIIASEIIKRGGKIRAYDPKAIDNFKQSLDSENIAYKNSKYDVLDGADALVLITEWKEFRALDLDELSKRLNQKIIFDGRNIYSPKIRKAGFELYQIGC